MYNFIMLTDGKTSGPNAIAPYTFRLHRTVGIPKISMEIMVSLCTKLYEIASDISLALSLRVTK